MPTKLKAAVVSVSVAVVLFIAIGGLGVRASNSDGAYRQMGVYSEVLSRIRSEYVEEPNFNAVTDGALHGLLESLDANSSYLNPAEYKQLKERKGDTSANIGAVFSKRFGYAAVVSVLPGSPADKAGLEPGLIIEAIEGRSTRDMSLAGIRNLFAGEKGSNISFAVVRPRKAEPEKLVVTRDFIVVPPTTEKVLEKDIGYLKPEALTKGKARDLEEKIRHAQNSGAKKLILDLRNVAEGDPGEGVAVANLFLDRGTIAFLKGQRYPREDFNADPRKAVTNLPLVVLVNRGTAGPAEIVAAAILENGRGDVLGDKTFGIGSVQKVIEIPDGSALVLSIAKYYSPSGKAIQDSAVTPNMLVPDAGGAAAFDEDQEDDDTAAPPDQTKPRAGKEDDQLQRAIAVLKNKTS